MEKVSLSSLNELSGVKSSCSTRPMNVENSSGKTFVIYFLSSGANLCRLKCQNIFFLLWYLNHLESRTFLKLPAVLLFVSAVFELFAQRENERSL